MKESRVKAVFAELEKELPPIVFRNWTDWKKYIPFSPRTLANMDSLGTGPDERVLVGRVIGYPRESLIRFLRTKTRLA